MRCMTRGLMRLLMMLRVSRRDNALIVGIVAVIAVIQTLMMVMVLVLLLLLCISEQQQ